MFFGIIFFNLYLHFFNPTLMILVYFFNVICYAKNVAIILNTSKDYSNYRHTTNILLFQKILTDLNPNFTDILMLSTEDILTNARNTHPGFYFIDNKTKFYADIKLTTLSCNLILNILSGHHPYLHELDIDTNIVVYICGHGGDGFIKILDREFLLKTDLTDSLVLLSNKVNKLLIILDTCQAESILDFKKFKDNTSIIITSKRGEPSVSQISSSVIGCNVIDGFMSALYGKINHLKSLCVEELVNECSFDEVGSTVKFYGSNFKLIDFIENENEINEKEYVL